MMIRRMDEPTRPLGEHDLLHWSPDTSTPDTPAMVRSHAAIPAHVETALQRRYAHPSTVNHAHWRAEHCRCLATEAAPSAPLAAPRRWGWPEVATAAAIVAIVIALVALLRQPIVTGV